MKDVKVNLAVQAELDNNMDDMMKQVCWIEIIKGMEMLERVEYKHEVRGQVQLLDPSNPKVLNCLDGQSMKSLNMHVTGGTNYTAAFSASLGNMAYAR